MQNNRRTFVVALLLAAVLGTAASAYATWRRLPAGAVCHESGTSQNISRSSSGAMTGSGTLVCSIVQDDALPGTAVRNASVDVIGGGASWFGPTARACQIYYSNNGYTCGYQLFGTASGYASIQLYGYLPWTNDSWGAYAYDTILINLTYGDTAVGIYLSN